MKLKHKIILLTCLMAIIILPQIVLAADNPALDKLDNVGTVAGPYNNPGDKVPLLDVVGIIINVALSLIGVVFLVLMILAGYNWMSAQGDEEKVTKAKSTILRAIIGIVIVVGAYGIWRFVFSKLF